MQLWMMKQPKKYYLTRALWAILITYLLVVIGGHMIVLHKQSPPLTPSPSHKCVCESGKDDRSISKPDTDSNVDKLDSRQDPVVDGIHKAAPFLENATSFPPFIFYNRVPKCGSSSTRKLIQELSKLHNFTFIQAHTYMKFWLTGTERAQLMERLRAYNKPLVFERHIHFLDFVSSGMRNPTYINLIRDPIERLASWYYFRRFQPGHVRRLPLEEKIRSYDECVLGNHPECTSPQGDQPEVGHFKIIPFFCGQDPECREPTERSLLRAIDNVKRYYLVVGLTERYEEFLQVLEHLLPRYFAGVSEIYNRTGGTNKHETIYKLPISPEAKGVMGRTLLLEYQFYDFIKRRFQKQVNKFLKKS